MFEVLLDLHGVAAVVEVDGIAEDSLGEGRLLTALGGPGLVVGPDPSDRVPDHVDQPHVGEMRGDPLRHALVPGIFGVGVRRLADRQDVRTRGRELLPVPVDAAVPVRLRDEELGCLVLGCGDLWMRVQVVVQARRPGLHRTDEQECREPPPVGAPSRVSLVTVPLPRVVGEARGSADPGGARARQRGRSWRMVGRVEGIPYRGVARTAGGVALGHVPGRTAGARLGTPGRICCAAGRRARRSPTRGRGACCRHERASTPPTCRRRGSRRIAASRYANLRTGPEFHSVGSGLGPQFRAPCVGGHAPREKLALPVLAH